MMKKLTIWSMVALACPLIVRSQVNIDQSFATTTTPSGWSIGSGALSTSQSCATASWRGNVYSGNNRILTSNSHVSNGDDLTISFDYKIVNWSAATVPTDPYDGTITTEVSIDNGTTWTVIAGTIDNGNHIPVATCANVTYVVPGASVPTGNTVKIRWNCVFGTTGDYYVYIDNIVATQPVTNPPACTTLTSPANGATDIVSGAITWAAATGAPTGYKLSVGTTSGATDILNMQDVGNVTTYTIPSLSVSTTYYVTVTPYNAIGDATGGCAESSFSTCSPHSIPYFEGFENGQVHNTVIAGCISQQSVAGTAAWTANNTLTTYNRTPRTGAWNAFLQYSNTDWAYIPVTLTGGTSYTVELYARQDGATATNADITIAYGTAADASAMTTDVVSATGIVNGNYQLIQGTFTPASTGTYFVGIRGYMNGSPWYISLDDISIYETPSCIQPINLMASASNNSANLSWTDPNASEWEIEWGPTGFTQGSGTIISGVSATSYVLNPLDPSTAYDFYVRAVCGATQSTWDGPYSFTTLCDPYTAPYFEGFENGYTQNATVAGCLFQSSVSGTYAWTANDTLVTYNRAPRTGSWNAYLHWSDEQWLIVPIVLTGGTSYNVDVYARQDGSNPSNSNIAISYGTTYDAAGMTEEVVAATGIVNGNYQLISGQFTPSSTGTYYVGIKGYMNSTPYYISLDDIAIYATPAPAITDFTSTVACGTSTELSINGTGLSNASITIGGTPITLASNNDTLITASISAPLSGTIEITTAGGMTSSSSAFSFAVAPAFSINATGSLICENGTTDVITVTAGASDYTTYVWTPSTGFTGDETNGWTITASAAGTYTLEASNVAGCSQTASYALDVTPLPLTLDVSQNAVSICEGATSQEISASGTLPLTEETSTTLSFISEPLALAGYTDSTVTLMVPALPAGSVVTGTSIVFNDVTTTASTWVSDLDVTVTGDATLATTIMAPVDNVVTNAGPYELSTSLIPSSGGTVSVNVESNYSGASTLGSISLVINYVLPAEITWWTAATGGTQLSTGDTLETIGTSVLPTAQPGVYHFYAEASNGTCAMATREEVIVTVSANTESTTAVTSCESYTWTNGMTYTTSGTYTQILTNAAGCDSTANLDLTITVPTTSTVTMSACESYTWALNGMEYTVSGMYNDTLVNAAGCDSIVTLNLTINQVATSTVVASSCETYTWALNNMTYTVSGMYNDTLTTVAGCDSIVTLNLTILDPTSSTVTETACLEYTWNLTGLTYTVTGMYYDTLVNAAGCDSIVTLDLTITGTAATAIDNGDATITASAGTSYEWIDCATNTAISGETGQTFAPAQNGNYAVIVTNAAGCSDTSNCVFIGNVGIKELTDNNVSVFPNPTAGDVTIEMVSESATVQVIDAQGKVIAQTAIQSGDQVSLGSYDRGVYILKVTTERGTSLHRIVKN